MTQATYARLPAIVQRHFVPQKIYIKGKGDMQTYSADVHSLPAF